MARLPRGDDGNWIGPMMEGSVFQNRVVGFLFFLLRFGWFIKWRLWAAAGSVGTLRVASLTINSPERNGGGEGCVEGWSVEDLS